MDEINMLNIIQNWFAEQCNGDWEHGRNIVIETIDNPGWSIFINLENTTLEQQNFRTIDIERSDTDWIYCIVEEKKFKSACGPKNLIEVLSIFVHWLQETQEVRPTI